MNAVIAVSRAMRAGVLPAELCDRDLLVLLAYAEHAGPSGEAWPSGETVAAMVRVSRSSVTRSIRALVAAGLLVPGKRRRNDSTVYTLNLSKLGDGQPDDRLSDDVQSDDRQSDSDDRQSDALSSQDPPTLKREPRGQRGPKPTPSKPKRLPKTDLPDDPGIAEWLKRWEVPQLDDPAMGRRVSQWLNHHRAHGNQFSNWRSAWLKWLGFESKFSGGSGLRAVPTPAATKPPKKELPRFDPDRDLDLKLGVGT